MVDEIRGVISHLMKRDSEVDISKFKQNEGETIVKNNVRWLLFVNS